MRGLEQKPILVVGLGNPILGDDGVGWKVAEQLRDQVDMGQVDIEFLAVGGLRLMEFMIGYEQAIIIDALTSWTQPAGQVTMCPLELMPDLSAGHTSSAHDTSLQTALSMGRNMGFNLPAEVMVVGIEAQQVYDFSEELSEPVTAAVPDAVQRVVELIDIYRRNCQDDLP